jgi:hypothetical protein
VSLVGSTGRSTSNRLLVESAYDYGGSAGKSSESGETHGGSCVVVRGGGVGLPVDGGLVAGAFDFLDA